MYADTVYHYQMWVTDAIYLPNCHKVVISSTRRDLRFYDFAGNQMIEDYHLYGLSNVAHCLAYHYDEQVTAGTPDLNIETVCYFMGGGTAYSKQELSTVYSCWCCFGLQQ